MNITLGSNTYQLIALPGFPGFADLSLTMEDSVAVVPSPYVPSQVQTQTWPGADHWGLQANLPKMTQATAAAWIGFMAGLRGRTNVFQVGNVARPTPLGVARGAPLVDGTIGGGNATTATLLNTKGWIASVYRQLLAGDYLQIGNRLHMVTAQVDSDINGKAQISIWPSLRETPADGAAINLVKPRGVFRLATNQRAWHTTTDYLVQMSITATEVR